MAPAGQNFPSIALHAQNADGAGRFSHIVSSPGTWRYEVMLSANAAARAVPGEKPFDLAWRMAAEMMAAWTTCVAASSPKTTVGWYGGGFPDPIYSSAGISAQPSEYGPMHYLSSYADSVRSAKQHQGKMAQGKPRHLLPWLTSGTCALTHRGTCRE